MDTDSLKKNPKTVISTKYLLIGLVISSSLIVISYLATSWLHSYMESNFRSRVRGPGGPLQLLVTTMNAVDPNQRIALIQKIYEEGRHPYRLILFDSENNELISVASKRSNKKPRTHRPPPAPLTYEEQRFNLAGTPAQTLVVQTPVFQPRGMGPQFFITFGILSLALILGVLGTIWLLVASFRERVQSIDSVITKLKQGDLDARIPVKKMDELGAVINRFNQMADEIQRVVSILRKTDASRTLLLSELAHDLRTPISSVQTLLETLSDKHSLLSSEKQKEILATCSHEIKYFAELVEDLLFLSRVIEPRYITSLEPVELDVIAGDEIKTLNSHYPHIQAHVQYLSPDIPTLGDGKLLRRLLRNALDNAFSFARSEVKLEMKSPSRGFVEITILDDGPGFKPEDLKQFGHRRMSRNAPSSHRKRISVGLGSVIIKSIVEAYGGQLVVDNRSESTGAKLWIKIPIQ